VHPLGLVAKGTTWYLVSDTDDGMRTFRVDRVRAVTVTDEPVRRPPGVNLQESWAQILAGLDDQRFAARVTARADPSMLGVLRSVFGTRLTVGDPAAGGRVDVEIRGHAEAIVGAELAGFADHVEVLAPQAVRDHLAHLGASLTRSYGNPGRAPDGRGRSGRSPTADLRHGAVGLDDHARGTTDPGRRRAPGGAA